MQRRNYLQQSQAKDLVNALIQSESKLPEQVKASPQYDEILTINMDAPSKIQLKKNSKTIAPILITLQTKDNYESQQQNRVGIDLVCVIDVSGSMSGSPLQLVQESLETLVDLLEPQDRLSLVTFSNNAELKSPLLALDQENKGKLNQKIKELRAGGGTDIAEGMGMAAMVMEQRQQCNPVSFIFLLSDGDDNEPGTVARVNRKIRNMKDVGIYTFGYGSENDASIMSSISGQGLGGHYYFIHKKQDVSEFLVMALGGCFSVFTWNTEVHLKATNGKILQIYRTKKEQKSQIWKVGALLFGKEKQMVIEMEFNGQLNDENRNRKCLEVEFIGQEVAAGVQARVKKEFVCSFCSEEEEVKQEISEDLAVNYFLVKGQEKLEKLQKKFEQDSDSDSGNDENEQIEGKKKLNNLQKELENFEYKDNPKLKQLKKGIKLQLKVFQKGKIDKAITNKIWRSRRQAHSRSASISSNSRSCSRSISSRSCLNFSPFLPFSTPRATKKNDKTIHSYLQYSGFSAYKQINKQISSRSRSRSRSSSRLRSRERPQQRSRQRSRSNSRSRSRSRERPQQRSRQRSRQNQQRTIRTSNQNSWQLQLAASVREKQSKTK